MSKCAACGKFVSTGDSVKCSGCNTTFDRSCLKIPKTSKLPPRWFCSGCTNKQSTKENREDSVFAHKDAVPNVDLSFSSPSGCGGCEDLKQFLVEIKNEMKAIRHDLNIYRNDLNKRMDGMESRIAALEEGSSGSLSISEQNKDLLDTVSHLKYEFNDREQELFLTDVEIACIPEKQGENLTHLVRLIADKLDVKLDDRDIVSVERSGPLRARMEGEGPPRPRPLVARLARRALRDQLLRSARIRRGADTTGFELPGPPRRFYVNERLTRYNRQLFFAARQEGKRLGWKYVWTRDGRIYARQRPDSALHRIRTQTDINKVFIC